MKNLLVLGLCVSFIFSTTVYEKVVLPASSGALCLDGSPGAYYLSQGDPNKILLSFEGGGWCGGVDLSSALEDCYQRSKTGLGSSKDYPSSVAVDEGILSDNQNNYFRAWTRVHFKYCTGTGHQGYKTSSIPYKDANLYFRGHNVTIGLLNSVDQKTKLFSSATHVVITGQSAGGLATYLWTNYIADRLSKTTKVWSIPDSGIFLDSFDAITKTRHYRDLFLGMMKYSNMEIVPPVPECVAKYPDEPVNCLFAENIHEFIKVPLFAIQSLYDSWSLYNIIGMRCPNYNSLKGCSASDRAYIEQYHQNTSRVLFAIGNKNQNGFWAPICVDHVYSSDAKLYSTDYAIPARSMNTLQQGLSDWMNQADVNPRHIDFGVWPANLPCAGATVSLRNNNN